MNCLDSSVVIDVLDGEETVVDALEEHDDPFYAPTIVRSEVLEGLLAGWFDGADAGQSLSWLRSLGFTREAALEAAHVRMEFRRDGETIPDADTFIAGVVRANGATLITQDAHFERVEGINVAVL